MKKFLLLIGVCISVCAAAQIEKVIPKKPSPHRLVNDFTGTLTAEQKDALELKLVRFDDSTTNQLAIVIIPTTDGFPIENVALRLLRDWGVGSKENNNGIIILIAKNDRKIRIEVGFGLEGVVPDITAKSIIDNDLTPNFREENYYRGLDQATNSIIKATAGEYKALAGNANKKGRTKVVGLIIFILVIIFSILGSIGRKGGGGIASRRGWGEFATGWIIGSMMSGGSRGGGWSGGGGGGFGGFGGGGGGGGGASGGW